MSESAAFHHLFMRVSDLARSRAFYAETLGLAVLWEEDGYIRLGGPDGFHIGMEQGDAAQVGGRGIEINIAVDDVDRRYAELREHGVAFAAPPADMPWGARHAFFADPDGYPLSIFTAVCE